MPQELGFRPSKLRVDATAAGVSLVLCNDKLSTYGAPDVLQLSVEELDGHFSKHHLFADRPANQVGGFCCQHCGAPPCSSLLAGHLAAPKSARAIRSTWPHEFTVTQLVAAAPSGCPGARMQAGQVSMRLWASFLNNSSSRWEGLWENWPLHCDMMDLVSPIYRSDFQR